MHIDLNNKKILITGASNGIGKALAIYLMKLGAQVAVHYHSNKESAEELVRTYPQTKSKAFKANLEIENEVIQLFEAVIDDFGSIDTIILNAGIYQEHPVENTTKDWLKVWKQTMAVNLDAVGLLTKLGIDHFIKRNGGRFVFIGSRAVFRGETAEYLAYAASKGGITSLARSVARSFGKHNIKSFIVSPGFTRTQMAESFIAKYGEQRVLDEISLNTLTNPEDLAPMIALMCAGLMDHATGATIDVNAGSHIR